MTLTTKFKLSGLVCGACEKIVSKKLHTIEGVEQVYVTSEKGFTSIMSSRPIDIGEVTIALEGTHFKVINNY